MNKDIIGQLTSSYGDTRFETEFSEEVWATTYKDKEESSINETFFRVASSIASKEVHDGEWTENFFDLFSGFKFTPGGRILSNAGTEWKGTTFFNCYVGVKPDFDQDSIEGIYATLLAQAQTLKSEGGWGMNFSFIRPRGSFIEGIGSQTPGAVKFMELFDKSSEIITEGSGTKKKGDRGKDKIRKGAMMAELDTWHPDIEEFITAKLTEGRLTKFNISAGCLNQFMDQIIHVLDLKKNGANKDEIEKADKWNLIFPVTTFEKYKKEWNGDIDAWIQKGYPINVYKTVSATGLFEQIVQSTYTRNDPGIQFLDRANETHLWNYGGQKAKIKSSNPCGEQFMPFGAACDLGSFNLTQFVNYNYTTEDDAFDLKKLKMYIKYAVRFLDNINDISSTPLKEYDEAVTKRRRIGLGLLGWGSSLYLLKTRFGSEKAEKIKATLMRTYTHTAVEESINLAEEKGMFEGCDPKILSEHPFWDQIDLPDELRMRIKKSGMRNSSLFSIQPTGNTGVLCNITSGGLEPVFSHSYIRTAIIPTCPEELLDLVPKYWKGEFHETSLFKYVKEGGDQILVGKLNDIVYKIDTNRGLTKEVLCMDYAVKQLIERGEWDAKADWACTTDDLTVDDHLTDMKGWCKWIDSSVSKTVNLPNDYPYDKFKEIYLDAYKSGVIKGITTYRAGTMMNVLKSLDESPEQEIVYTHAPRRPKSLDADIHRSIIDGKKWTIFVGLLHNKPYEIFGGSGENIEIPKRTTKGKIVKRKSDDESGDNLNVYDLIYGDEDDPTMVRNIVETFKNPNYATMTKHFSLELRHGIPIEYIVEQNRKDSNEGLYSFFKVVSRVLKKYIEDGANSKELCPECGNILSFREGCYMCPNCAHSKCE